MGYRDRARDYVQNLDGPENLVKREAMAVLIAMIPPGRRRILHVPAGSELEQSIAQVEADPRNPNNLTGNEVRDTLLARLYFQTHRDQGGIIGEACDMLADMIY